MNLFQLVLISEGFLLVMESSESLLNLETELLENLSNASSKVGRVSSSLEGSGISWSAGAEGVLFESVVS